MAKASTPREKSLALVSRIVTALDDKKATDIRVIDVSAQSGVTDFFVIATGAADQHLRGLRMEIERVLDEDGVKIVGVESQPESGWTVVDCFDVIAHLFRADQRANFQFEKLWKDGKELPAKNFITNAVRALPEQAVLISGNSKTPAEKKAAAKPATKKAATKTKAAAGEKAPIVKAGVKAVVEGTARIARRAAAKAKKTRLAEESAAKTAKAVKKPVKASEKKIIAEKAVKNAKLTRAKAKAKSKANPLEKPAAAKAGVVTRKAKRA